MGLGFSALENGIFPFRLSGSGGLGPPIALYLSAAQHINFIFPPKRDSGNPKALSREMPENSGKIRVSKRNGQCFGNPNPYNLPKKYGSTPSICTAVRPPFVSPYFPGFQASNEGKPRSTPPVCTAVRPPIGTAVRPPFVRQYFWKSTGGWGHRNVSEERDERNAKKMAKNQGIPGNSFWGSERPLWDDFPWQMRMAKVDMLGHSWAQWSYTLSRRAIALRSSCIAPLGQGIALYPQRRTNVHLSNMHFVL